MAWMKSTSSDSYYLTGEFTQRKIASKDTIGISKVLGFDASPANSDQIKAELARVAANRAALIADIVAALKA